MNSGPGNSDYLHEMKIKPGKPLPTKLLIRSCEPAKLKFDSTEALLPFSDVPGQNRAAEAIHFATEMDVDGHNVFVLGLPGLVPTPTGVVFVPIRGGETIAPGEFEKLSKAEQEKVKKDIEELSASLQHVMRTAPKLGGRYGRRYTSWREK